ncbi:MAG TPA: alanine--glyoxylate aminotransferase family protein [Desulfurobacteriaceae bacterium]|nr:alanine--glyoxylate aminotransferase family protein [Desulfurobacteriaceae bacterium]
MKKYRILTPGPTPVPEEVKAALFREPLYHRGLVFKNIMKELQENFKKLLKTERVPVFLTSSGTGAMEASIVNFFKPEEDVLIVVGGKFGERFFKIAKRFGLNPICYEIEWGDYPKVEKIEKYLKENKNIKGVFIQICETSTGTFYPYKEIGEVCKKYDALLIADGITAVGVYNIEFDKSNIDILITGSQKALMTPPGVSAIIWNEKAHKRLGVNKRYKYYFDLEEEYKNQKEKFQTAYTPSVNLYAALNEALKVINKIGIEKIEKNTSIMSKATLKAFEEINLKPLSKNPAIGVSAICLPDSIDGNKLIKFIRENFNMYIAGGQGHLKGKIFRLCHFGYIDIFDTLNQISAVEFALSSLGYNFNLGTATKKAMEIISQYKGA